MLDSPDLTGLGEARPQQLLTQVLSVVVHDTDRGFGDELPRRDRVGVGVVIGLPELVIPDRGARRLIVESSPNVRMLLPRAKPIGGLVVIVSGDDVGHVDILRRRAAHLGLMQSELLEDFRINLRAQRIGIRSVDIRTVPVGPVVDLGIRDRILIAGVELLPQADRAPLPPLYARLRVLVGNVHFPVEASELLFMLVGFVTLIQIAAVEALLSLYRHNY